ncbi:MAG: helix-turn-helix domain-containing protein [Chitinophagales bacterium]|nr:helix-turn-helix domain-containing protein [Chitinophagales bacterium]
MENIKVLEQVDILRALNHKVRRTLVQLLDEQDILSYSDILAQVSVDTVTLDNHLTILENANLVFKLSPTIKYTLNRVMIAELNLLIE